MSVDPSEGLQGFLDKWRARWPEWRVAEVFVPAADREKVLAWFALQQELTDAAWGGSDPRPGEAKLGWWAEELLGWSQGRRRHPLGMVLQRLPAPWARLATALPALQASRERAADFDEARHELAPFADALATLTTAIHASAPGDEQYALCLLGQRAVSGDAQAVPLQAQARAAADASLEAASRAWAQVLLAQWPLRAHGSGAERIRMALLRARLQRLVAVGTATAPAPWRSLLLAWRAARN